MSAVTVSEWRNPRWRALAFFLGAVVANELFVARLLSPDGRLEPAMVWSVRYMQAALAICGVGMLLKRRSLITGLLIVASALNLVVFQQQAKTGSGRSVEEERLLGLRRLLPASGRVGYVTDELLSSSNAALARYYQTQYAVAPVVVVVEGPTPEWVIGNFRDARSASEPRGMHVARDFGGGLILFRNTAR
jgi:hypothetical protein